MGRPFPVRGARPGNPGVHGSACSAATDRAQAPAADSGVVSMSVTTKRGRLRPLLSGVVLRQQADARLCALAAEGHQLAFTTIFERYEQELRAHAARIVRPERVDDVVQHTMLSAWSALLGGPPVNELRAWLHRIVHNAALNAVTRRGYDDGELASALASPTLTEDLVEGRLSAGEALAAIATLPSAQRQALTLTAIEGRTTRDVAAEMDLTESAARQLVYRARSHVRSAVSAITPLPLLAAITNGGGGAATVAGVGAAGSFGGVAVAAKAAAVLAIATGTLGATGSLPRWHHHGPAAHHTDVASTVANPLGSSSPPPVGVDAAQPGSLARPIDSLGRSRHSLNSATARDSRSGVEDQAQRSGGDALASPDPAATPASGDAPSLGDTPSARGDASRQTPGAVDRGDPRSSDASSTSANGESAAAIIEAMARAPSGPNGATAAASSVER